ncbi:cathepsin G-like [Mauremys reevesii]|uniref:cathepsin G-like n=1 Tax=Mauremys reevesii TaxID=260615 RepID=UPI00193F6F2A|nr:cathepsin G-like [Mauremys reevesii]
MDTRTGQWVTLYRRKQHLSHLVVQDFMEPGQNWKQIQACRWVQHLHFNNENFHNDTMPLKLWHSAELMEWVGPVSLLEANHHISPGSEFSVAGWGRTVVNTTTDRLQEAEQEVVSESLCKGWYQHYDSTTVLCTGSFHAKKSVFQIKIPPPGAIGGYSKLLQGKELVKTSMAMPLPCSTAQRGAMVHLGRCSPGRETST